jgi:hypothetical protein
VVPSRFTCHRSGAITLQVDLSRSGIKGLDGYPSLEGISNEVADKDRENGMKYLFENRVVLACALFATMSGTAPAQTTGALDPSPASADPSKGGVPPGGCMPIGLTASGEIVFPILCKEFIEQHRESDTAQKPSVVEQKVTVKPVEIAAPSEDGMPENSSSKPLMTEEKVTEKPPETVAPSHDVMLENSSSKPVIAQEKVIGKPVETAAPPEEVMPENSNPKPSVAEQKLSAKPAETAESSEAAILEKSDPKNKPLETAVSSRKTHKHESNRQAINQAGCQHYRTYDSASETYRSYDGRRRSCQ